MDENENIIYKDLSYKIIELALEMHNELGCGFLEKVYENALMLLLDREKILARQQAPADVYFQGKVIGQYFADILVDNKLLKLTDLICHTCESRYPVPNSMFWIPAFAGMTYSVNLMFNGYLYKFLFGNRSV